MILRFLNSFILLVAVYFNGYSQSFIFNRLSLGDGLLSNNVLTVNQDKSGYIWVGSENGLQRYDGVRFRTMWGERVDQILKKNDSLLWIRSGKSIWLFNPHTTRFTSVFYERGNEVLSNSGLWLKKDASGNTFLIITGKSCQYFSENNGRFSAANNPFLIPPTLPVVDVVEDHQKSRYWIVSRNDFGYWDRRTHKYYTISNNMQNDPILTGAAKYQQVSSFSSITKTVTGYKPAVVPGRLFFAMMVY